MQLFQFIDITNPTTGIATTSLVLGHVKYIHVRNDVLFPSTERGAGAIDPVKYKPIGRLGDVAYAPLGDIYRIPRPQWALEADKVKEAMQSSASEENGSAVGGRSHV